jgi:uncharacterized protein YcbK (DUF882 family)
MWDGPVPVAKARLKSVRFVAARAGYSCGLAVLVLLFGSRALQNAVAEGDTRSISMHHIHTDEDITITFKRDGRYDEAALDKINWFLRDWRKAEQTKMDPHLIDLVWEVQREAANKQPIWVVCGYRSPQTNAMLRHRSRGVARFSQHMLGRAMDFYIPGVALEDVRAMGLRLARGGVGFYPSSGSAFVHMDTGSIRMWPRMTREQLVRVFPDGRTVQIPTDGKPLPGYALALADIKKRGNAPSENSIEAARNSGVDVGVVLASNEHVGFNPLAKLFGLKRSDADDEDTDSTASASPAPAAAAPTKTRTKPVVVAAAERVKVAAAPPAAPPKQLIHTASFTAPAPAAPTPAPTRPSDANLRFAALSPNQVIAARGYWQSQTDGGAAPQLAAQSLLNSALRPRGSQISGTQVASADPNTTGSLNPLPGASDNRVPAELALAYAEQPGQDTPSHAVSVAAAATRAAADKASEMLGQSATTIAVKGLNDRPKTSVQSAIQLAVAAVKISERLDNPWLRAVILSPSVQRFLTTLALGTRDFTSLAALMAKPKSSVMMTFSSDPNLGLTQDHFSGSAIVFLSTITYPTRTASLQ